MPKPRNLICGELAVSAQRTGKHQKLQQQIPQAVATAIEKTVPEAFLRTLRLQHLVGRRLALEAACIQQADDGH